MVDKMKPHQVIWTEENSRFFWDYYSKNLEMREAYFGGQTGKGIIAEVKKRLSIEGRVLDYGCGAGMFLEHLLNGGIPSEGLDFSLDSVAEVEKKFKTQPLFRGAYHVTTLPMSIPDATYQVVFCLETLEHLIGDQLSATIQEIHRLVQPGGYVVITVPNDEHLDPRKVICPDCGGIFHPVQHVRSFNNEQLSELMSGYGFQTVVCKPEFFSNENRFWRALRAVIVEVIKKKPLPNLFYIGKKK